MLTFRNKELIGEYKEKHELFYREVYFDVTELNNYLMLYIKGITNIKLESKLHAKFQIDKLQSKLELLFEILKSNINNIINNCYIHQLYLRIDEGIYYITYNF